MKRPSLEDMSLAAEWLDINDGSDGEAESCKRVAAWLEASARESVERDAARKANVPVQALRKRLGFNLAAKDRAKDREALNTLAGTTCHESACEAIAISSDPDFRCVHCGKPGSAHRHQSRVASQSQREVAK